MPLTADDALLVAWVWALSALLPRFLCEILLELCAAETGLSCVLLDWRPVLLQAAEAASELAAVSTGVILETVVGDIAGTLEGLAVAAATL